MIRLTLRTLLAYLDDTLPPADAKVIGQKLAENATARELADRIRTLTRRRSLSTPAAGPEGSSTDPNIVAAYLSDALSPELVEKFEKVSLESDVQLAELAACHQILTLLLAEQVRVPPSAYQRMYGLVKGKESIPGRRPGRNAIPVGGVTPAEKPHEADEADAAYLLGLPAYSRNEPAGRKALRWGVASLLACGFVLAAWLAWPPSAPKDNSVAQVPPTTQKGESPPPTSLKEEPKKDDPKKDDTKPDEPKKDEPKKDDPKDDLGAKQPPLENRAVVAVNDAGNDQVLVAKRAAGDGWAVVAKGAEVSSTDRLVCLPGYKAKVQFKTGVSAELWGNVSPDVLPVPVYDTALTPFIPYDGFDADFTLHTGRVYLGNTRDTPVVVRVRVGDPKFKAKDQQFDLTLPDKGCELVVEVNHRLTPGAADDPPQTGLVLHVLKGTATLPVKRKTTTVAAGEVVVFDSARGEVDGPKKPDEKAAKGLAYFDRLAAAPDGAKARPMLIALGQFADRVKEAKTVPAAVAELRADPTKKPESEAAYAAGARFSVFATAALGDVNELADVANNPNRPDLRYAAVEALRGLLAAEPDRVDALRKLAVERWKLSADDADSYLGTLAGLGERRRRDADALKRLVDQLNADQVALREAALFVLVYEVDGSPQTQSSPLVFDVAGPKAARDAAAAGWTKRVADLLKEPK